MSAPGASARELVAFQGPVDWQLASGAVNLVLRGVARLPQRARAVPTQLLFSAASEVALPAGLHDATVIELAAGSEQAPRQFRIDSPGFTATLQAHHMQLHRDAAAVFYSAVPPARVPLRLRLAWALLLTALRVPGAAALLRTLRGSA